MVGAQSNPYLVPKHWELSLGFRWQNSFRHFVGVREQTRREREESEVINDLYLFDLTATYAITRRFNASISIPFQYANRSVPLRDANRTVIDRSSTQASGLGDISVTGRCWIFDPSVYLDQNVSIGLGVKFPTGEYDATDDSRRLGGTSEVTVDQSIQPGDGGYGMILEMQAFKQLFAGNLTLYTSATYLLNPEGNNGALTGRGRASEAVMSVPDQYIGKLGLAVPLKPMESLTPWQDALSLTMGGRIEGVPVDDAIGSSDGFRRPGYAISIEPGLIYSTGRNTFSLSAPVAVQRNRQRSNSDEEDDRFGDAAFADYLILFGYSYRF